MVGTALGQVHLLVLAGGVGVCSDDGESEGVECGSPCVNRSAWLQGCWWEATVRMRVEGDVNVRDFVLGCCPISPSQHESWGC